MLNWFCLLGAMSEAGMWLDWSAFVATDVFNSAYAHRLRTYSQS